MRTHATTGLTCLATAILLTSSGCAFTQKVWSDGRLAERPGVLESAWLSERGDVCLIYTATVERETVSVEMSDEAPLLLSGHPGWAPISPPVPFRRVLVLTRADIASLAAPARGPTHPWQACRFRGVELAGHVTPRGLAERGPSDAEVARLTAGWTRLPTVPAAGKCCCACRERPATSARGVRLAGRRVEVVSPSGDGLVVELPRRQSRSPWSYPVRVLLTPAAVAADAAALSPTILIYALMTPLMLQAGPGCGLGGIAG